MKKIKSFLNFMTFPFRPFSCSKLIPEKKMSSTGGPEKINFYHLLREWGLTWRDIPNQIQAHQQRIGASAFIVIFGILAMLQGLGIVFQDGLFLVSRFAYFLAGAGLVAYGSSLIIISLWRIGVYKNRQFTPFAHWLLRRK